jgi:hypothetical protein
VKAQGLYNVSHVGVTTHKDVVVKRFFHAATLVAICSQMLTDVETHRQMDGTPGMNILVGVARTETSSPIRLLGRSKVSDNKNAY